MKKILLTISIALISIMTAQSQDFEKATSLAKEANEKLVNGDAQAAAEGFTAALAEAQQCSDEGAAELIANCKKGLVQAHWSRANNAVKEGDFSLALEAIGTTIIAAGQYEEAEIAEKVVTLKTEVHQAYANAELKAASAEKDAAAKKAHFEAAAAQLDSVLVNSSDGKVLLQRGQVAGGLGNKEDAIKYFTMAKEAGEAKADAQLSKIYLKEAQALLKAGKSEAAIASASKSVSFEESANAYFIMGNAYRALGKKADAVTSYEKFLKLDPNNKNAAAVKQVIEALK